MFSKKSLCFVKMFVFRKCCILLAAVSVKCRVLSNVVLFSEMLCVFLNYFVFRNGVFY